jgi:hypothetical protein
VFVKEYNASFLVWQAFFNDICRIEETMTREDVILKVARMGAFYKQIVD